MQIEYVTLKYTVVEAHWFLILKSLAETTKPFVNGRVYFYCGLLVHHFLKKMPKEDQPVVLNRSNFWTKHENASVTASLRIRSIHEPMRMMTPDELNTLPFRKQERPYLLDSMLASTLPYPSIPPYKPPCVPTRTSRSVEREIFCKELAGIESDYKNYRKQAVAREISTLKINKALAVHMANFPRVT